MPVFMLSWTSISPDGARLVKKLADLLHLFNHLGWYTANYHIVRNILRDNSACCNDGILANGNARTDNGTDAYPRILFDGHLIISASTFRIRGSFL